MLRAYLVAKKVPSLGGEEEEEEERMRKEPLYKPLN